MCNDYEQHVRYAEYQRAIRALELSTPDAESASDLPFADDIKIGDTGPVLRAEGNGVRLTLMRFGWPPPRPKAGPVFNFKSDGRDFRDSRRCIIVLSGFFEFTGSKYPKAKHRFSLKDSPVMGIAGLWSDADGEDVPNARTIDVHVRRLRAKLGEYEEIIRTVRGSGYRFDRHADVAITYPTSPSPDRF